MYASVCVWSRGSATFPLVGAMLLSACIACCLMPAAAIAAPAAQTALPGPITEDRQLLVSESPYLVSGPLLISASVTVEPGVEFIFSRNASLQVEAGGSLIGSAGGAPIVFRGSSAQPYWWNGIVAQPGSVMLQLASCTISDAVVGLTASTPNLSLHDCTLHDNQTGLALAADGASGQQINNLTLRNNSGYALRYFVSPDLRADMLQVAPAIAGLVVTGNGNDAAQIDRSIAAFGWQHESSPAELRLSMLQTAGGDSLPFDLPDEVLGALQTLHIASGVTVRSEGIHIGSGATLTVEGDPVRPVRFAPLAAQAATGWKGIVLAAGSTATIDHCAISGARWPALDIGSNAIVTHCTLHNNRGYGLMLSEAGISPILDALTIVDNGGDAIAQRKADMQPRFTELTVAGNSRDARVLLDGFVYGEVTLDSLVTVSGQPLPIIGGISVQHGGYLRMMPGSEIYMSGSERLTVAAGGVLSATDVLFSSLVQEPGSWHGLDLQAGAVALIEDCTVAYANYAGITVAASGVTLRNCWIHHSASHAVYLLGNGLTPLLENLLIEDNAGAAVYEQNGQGATMNPAYRGLEVRRNGQDAIVLAVRSFDHDNHLEMPGRVGDSALPYIVPEILNVASGTTLIIDQGVVMRFTAATNWGYLRVNGQLLATGVTFEGREPTPGSWAGIWIASGARADLFGCQVLYAGDRTNHTLLAGIALRIDTQEPVTVHYCTLRDGDGVAVGIYGVAQVDMRWNNIYGNRWGVNSPSVLAGSIPISVRALAVVDARYSWWGHISGPANNPGNPDGQGDRVIGGALFDPWATSLIAAPVIIAWVYLPCVVNGQ